MTTRRLLLIGFAVLGSSLLAACSMIDQNPSPSAPSSASPKTGGSAAEPAQVPSPSAQTSVTIENFQFSPQSVTVKKGTTVTWTNTDSTPHTVTGDNGGPKSAKLATDAKYSYTFKTEGTFPYHCSVHPTMTATVTVTP